MDAARLRSLLEDVARGAVSAHDAAEALRGLPYEDLGFARVDHHRALRQGVPEVVLGEPKTVDQIVAIAQAIVARGDNLLVTRVAADKARDVCARVPGARYDEASRIVSLELAPPQARGGRVAVVTAGTSDIPVAEEAAEVLRLTGHEVVRRYDCGVAGLHRLLDQREVLASSDVVIAIAGMEGALPSVVGGLVACPVIAVPTSVGYGAHLGGLAPLMTMLTTCSAGVLVVNIDNGFGAAMAAARILRLKG
ncbi:MAG: nickel pincer cofactor biosynthesis protein LarB [Polyangiaceae bacterium]|nr:nickel pincer cofactor biosynthesis protein LarB [Polyangiaceae bacterium]